MTIMKLARLLLALPSLAALGALAQTPRPPLSLTVDGGGGGGGPTIGTDPYAGYTTYWAAAGANGSGNSASDPGDLGRLMSSLTTPRAGEAGKRILLLDTGGVFNVSGGGFKNPPLQFANDGRDANARLGLQNAPGHSPVLNCLSGQGITGSIGGAYHYWRGLTFTSSPGISCHNAIALADSCHHEVLEHIAIFNVIGGSGSTANTEAIMVRNCDTIGVHYVEIDGVRDSGGGTHVNTAAIHVYSTPNLYVTRSRFRNTRSGIFLKERELGTAAGLHGFPNAIAEYNLFETEVALQFGTSYESAGRRIRYNVIRNQGGLLSASIAIPQGDGNSAFDDVQFYGNTIVAGGSAATLPEVSNGNVGWNGSPGNQFYNNIVYLPGNSGDYFRMQNQGTGGTGAVPANFNLDYNFYHRPNSAHSWSEAGSTYTSLAAWRSATGKETNSVAGDPLFVDAANGDFRLRSGSPALAGAFDNGDGGNGEFGAYGGPQGYFMAELLSNVGPRGAFTQAQ